MINETKATIEAFRDKLKREPEGFIAQPTLALSTCPTCTASGLAPSGNTNSPE